MRCKLCDGRVNATRVEKGMDVYHYHCYAKSWKRQAEVDSLIDEIESSMRSEYD